MDSKYIIGCVYILYGLLKIALGISVMTVPAQVLKKVPVLRDIITNKDDNTLAGHLYEYVLLVFGVFSLLNGLSLLQLLPSHLIRLFEMQYTEYLVFITLGLILTIFYILVLYTPLPISKT